MNEDVKICEACGGPVEEGKYCAHCLDENGNLKSYEDVLNDGIEWAMSEEGEKILGRKFEDKDETKKMIEEHMKTLPAWKE
jgi:hypothetical protein